MGYGNNDNKFINVDNSLSNLRVFSTLNDMKNDKNLKYM